MAHEAAGRREFAKLVDRGHRVAKSERAVHCGYEEQIATDHQRLSPQLLT
jgi:hypothetical protein